MLLIKVFLDTQRSEELESQGSHLDPSNLKPSHFKPSTFNLQPLERTLTVIIDLDIPLGAEDLRHHRF